jgi:hypothetical protein
MSPVITPRRQAPTRNIRPALGVAFLLAVFVAAEAFALWQIRTPGFVDQVTIENPDVHDVEVDVGDADRKRWLGLGTAAREASRTFESVIDPGDTWVFRFRYGGVDGGEVVVSRDDLESNGWRVRVPAEVGARLTQAGLGPSMR